MLRCLCFAPVGAQNRATSKLARRVGVIALWLGRRSHASLAVADYRFSGVRSFEASGVSDSRSAGSGGSSACSLLDGAVSAGGAGAADGAGGLGGSAGIAPGAASAPTDGGAALAALVGEREVRGAASGAGGAEGAARLLRGCPPVRAVTSSARH